MTNTVIAGYARSPFHFASKGGLARVRPDDLAAQVVRALITRTGVKPEDIEDIIVGCAFPEAEQGLNVARLIGLLADLPLSVAGVTVNRFCGSSMQSIHIAAGQIALGAGDVFVCAGIESMSRVPMMGYNPLINPALMKSMPAAYIGMGETAENVARKWQIPRSEQEAFAVRSHQRAAAAVAAGKFNDEIVPIVSKGGSVDQDGCIRPDTTAEGLAGLKPAFDKDGTVTAGTASPLTDGAAAVLVCSEAYADKHGLQPLARIKSIAVAGCAPEIMGIGPVAATKKALARAGIEIGGDRRGGTERGVRQPGHRLRPRTWHPRRDPEPRWRRDRARSSAGGDRRSHHRQGRVVTGPHRRPLRAGEPVHRRRPGHRHDPGTRVMADPTHLIKKVGVIGAGTMGAGIAAQVANAGVPVVLLDIVPPGANNRNALAEGAIAKMRKAEPAAFMHDGAARLIDTGNLEDDLAKLGDCDWIVEAVLERTDIKQALYRKLEARPPARQRDQLQHLDHRA